MSLLFIAGQPLAETITSVDYPRPERLVQGNPKRTTQALYEHPNMSCGIWECEVGAWKIVFAANKQEFFQVISGKVRLHSEDGSFHDITAGNAGVIPPSFCGTFEVLEAVKKYYVIVEN